MGQIKDFNGATGWTDFKARLNLKQSKIQELSLIGGEYTLFFTENTDLYRVSIVQASADGIDYETNYQPTANQRTELPVNVENTVNVATDATGTPASDYLDHGTITAGNNNTHTIIVPASTTYKIRQIIITGTGAWKANIIVDSNIIATYTGNTNAPSKSVSLPIDLLAGEVFKITVFNLEPSRSQCFYTTLIVGVIN